MSRVADIFLPWFGEAAIGWEMAAQTPTHRFKEDTVFKSGWRSSADGQIQILECTCFFKNKGNKIMIWRSRGPENLKNQYMFESECSATVCRLIADEVDAAAFSATHTSTSWLHLKHWNTERNDS